MAELLNEKLAHINIVNEEFFSVKKLCGHAQKSFD